MKDFTVELLGADPIRVITDMTEEELECAAINWAARTKKLTVTSLCNYINNKGLHTAHPYQTPDLL